jgi:hypothetical protein
MRFKIWNKNIQLITLAVLVILGVGTVSAFGFGKGFINKNLNNEEKAQIQEERKQMENAIADNDYTAWKALMEQRITKMQSELTNENFKNVVEEHKKIKSAREAIKLVKESGNYSKVEEKKAQYGLKEGGHKKGDFIMQIPKETE